jgi:hypothetical protein
MVLIKRVSEKKKKLLDEKNSSEFSKGECVYVKKSILSPEFKNLYQGEKDRTENCTVLKVLKDKLEIVVGDNSVNNKRLTIQKSDVEGRDIWRIGANPFDETFYQIRPVAFTLESILFGLNVLGEKRFMNKDWEINGVKISDCNWNPFIYNKEGKKEYYQRPFVWTLAEKQLLIDSIYQGIDCGKILVRKRGWKELEKMQAKGETELSFNDIVDGKQRLEAMRGFIMGEYADSNGNYFGDLSANAQNRLTNNQFFSYAEMPEETKDAMVIRQFLKLNFTGIPQSKGHIDFVKSLLSKV